MKIFGMFDTAIKKSYGSKKGLLYFYLYKSLALLGFYNKYKFKNIPFAPKRLVFVCVGNICRSPLGEAIARHHDVNAKSFGLSTRGGDKADPRAIKYATVNGYDLDSHITCRIDEYSELDGDVVLVMEPKHIYLFRQRFKNTPLVLLGLQSLTTVPYIHDPYNTNPIYFNKCENLVAECTLKVLRNGAE